VFDVNPPITTDQVDDNDPTKGIDPNKQDLNTIDAVAPASTVAPLAATTTSNVFTVSWSGSDDPGGSGISAYDIFVSDNGGPFTLWQSDSTQTSAVYDGAIGHAYGFYSVAADNAGNVQATPTSAQATTRVIAPAVLEFAASQFTANVTQGSASIVISRTGNLSATLTVNISTPGDTDVAAFSKTISFAPNSTSQSVTIPIINNGQSGQADQRIALVLSQPGSGATLGASASTTLVIHDNNGPTKRPLET
jgi:hypothetical protein